MKLIKEGPGTKCLSLGYPSFLPDRYALIKNKSKSATPAEGAVEKTPTLLTTGSD